MKKLITCILALATVHCSHESSKTEFHCLGVVREYKISKDSVTGRNEKFVEHVGAKKFENYVVISLPYSVFDPLFENLQKDFGALKSRGEAHVTIITPPEFDEVLSSTLR